MSSRNRLRYLTFIKEKGGAGLELTRTIYFSLGKVQ